MWVLVPFNLRLECLLQFWEVECQHLEVRCLESSQQGVGASNDRGNSLTSVVHTDLTKHIIFTKGDLFLFNLFLNSQCLE